MPPQILDEEYVPASISDEIDPAAIRALKAGADAPLTYIGAGMTSITFLDVDGRAYKVFRSPKRPITKEFAQKEAEWLANAGESEIAEHVAEFYSYDPDNVVIVKEFIDGRPGGWGTPGLHDLHARIEQAMIPVGWTAPEFKEDSYVIDATGRPILVDASMPHRVGDNLLGYVQAIIDGHQDPYTDSSQDLGFALRSEIGQTITKEDARPLLKALGQPE